MKKIIEGWYKLGGEEIEDLEKYIYEQYSQSELNKTYNLELVIGTDAAIRTSKLAKFVKKDIRERTIHYMTVIVFKKGNTGSHVIFRRQEEKRVGFIPTAIKLNGEIAITSELALWMMDLNLKPEIHLDLNSDPTTGSFQVYSYIKGYFESLGLITKYKNIAPAATAVADYYL